MSNRVTGVEREVLAASLAEAYKGGASIRDLAKEHQRSYGSVHRLLVEAGAHRRGRGGDNKTRARTFARTHVAEGGNALSWALHAACRGRDLDEFFTDSKIGVRRAKQFCAACPVRQQCLAEALRSEDGARYGIYGGLTAAERGQLVRSKAVSR